MLENLEKCNLTAVNCVIFCFGLFSLQLEFCFIRKNKIKTLFIELLKNPGSDNRKYSWFG